MKKARLFCVLFALVFMISIVAACGNNGRTTTAPTTAPKGSETTKGGTGEKYPVMGGALQYDPNVPVNGGEEITLNFWVPSAWEDFYRKWTEEYRKFHPNINFEFSLTSFEDHWNKVPLALQSDLGPDLFWMHNDATQIMIPHMEPMPESIFPRDALKKDFRQIESNTIDGKLYYTDLGLMTGVIFYNLDMWEEAGLSESDIPLTWDELIEVAKKLTRKDSSGNIQVAGFNMNGAEYIWNDMVYQQGKWLFADDNKTALFTSEEALNAAQLMSDMYHVHEIGSGTQPRCEEAFANSKAAMIYCWGWATNYFKSNFPNLNYSAFALPGFTDDDPASGRTNGDVTPGVAKNDDPAKVAAAFDFVLYMMCNDDMIIEYNIFDGMAPTKYSLDNHPSIQEEPVLKVQSKMLDKAIWPGPVPGNYFTDVQNYIGQAVLINNDDPEAALAEAQKMVNNNLDGQNFVTVEKDAAVADRMSLQ